MKTKDTLLQAITSYTQLKAIYKENEKALHDVLEMKSKIDLEEALIGNTPAFKSACDLCETTIYKASELRIKMVQSLRDIWSMTACLFRMHNKSNEITFPFVAQINWEGKMYQFTARSIVDFTVDEIHNGNYQKA